MLHQDRITQLKELLPTAQSIVVLLGPNPTFDQVATATGLALSLQDAGKEVTLASPDQLEERFQVLSSSDQVKQKLGNQNLSISFEYNEQAVDKVSYHISDDNSRFYLVVKPQKGHPPLNTNSVSFDYTGADADLVFLVGVHTFELLEHLYSAHRQLFENATVVTFHTFEPAIGNIKLDASGSSSLSEAMYQLLQGLELSINAPAATNLLAGVEEVTEGFHSLTTTAETFETVGALMRLGARRIKRTTPLSPPPQVQPPTTPPTRPTVSQSVRPTQPIQPGRSELIQPAAAQATTAQPATAEPARTGQVVSEQDGRFGPPDDQSTQYVQDAQVSDFSQALGRKAPVVMRESNPPLPQPARQVQSTQRSQPPQPQPREKQSSRQQPPAPQSSKKRRRKKKNKGGEPGSLSYQPGEGGVGKS